MCEAKNSVWLLLTTAALAALLAPANAWAVAPAAYTVPWVATNPTVPHDTWSNKLITFKGASDTQGTTIQYSWDYGDGTVTPFAPVSNMYVIEGTHAYTTGTPDATVFAATLTVTNTNTGESSVTPYYVKLRNKTLEVEVNLAIDEGLWVLHKNLTRNTCGTNSLPCGYWNSGYVGHPSHAVSSTAANVNAFEVNGHLENDPRGPANPYADDVARGLRYIISNLSPLTLSVQTNPLGTFNPSTSGTNQGLYYNSSWAHYETGMIMDALIASGNPNGIVSMTGTNASGFTYKQVAQYMLDWANYCQTDAAPYGGSFYYTCNATYSDNSAAQWTAIGMIAAERVTPSWGLSIPQIVKDWNRSWLTYSQQPTNGIFGYQSSSPAWGPFATSPSGMVQMVMDGVGRSSPSYQTTCNLSGNAVTRVSGTPFDAPPTAPGYTIAINNIGYRTIQSITDADHLTITQSSGTANNQLCWFGPSWAASESLMRDAFDSTSTDPTVNPKEYMYGLFSFTKSMLLHEPPIQFLHSSDNPAKTDLDWYAAQTAAYGGADPTNGVARTLINYQCPAGTTCSGVPGGAWWGHTYYGDQYYFTTAWAIIMLNRTIFTAGAPVAVATASPNPAVAGATVTLSGSASFHQDPNKQIVKWDWNGITVPTFTASGPVVQTSFGAVGNYQVRLTVTDNVGTTAQTIVTVQVAIPPLPPTANAGGPYSFCPNRTPWFVDGRNSTVASTQGEPGAPNNFITAYAWDLNGGSNFNVPGATPDVTTFFTAKGPGNYLIQLQVTDNSALSYPSAQGPNLTATASGQVTVRAVTDPACANCISNLGSLPKNKMVQLSWSLMAGADHYNVYRSTVSGGPYNQIGTAATTQTYYFDNTVTNGTTYYYVLRPAALNGAENCQSNQVSAKPMATR